MNQKKTFKPTLLLLKNLTYKTGRILVIDKCLHTMVGGCVNIYIYIYIFLKAGREIFFPKPKPISKITYQPQLPVLMAISSVWLCLVLNLLETSTQTPFFFNICQY